MIHPHQTVLALAGEPRKPGSVARLRELSSLGARRVSARLADIYGQLENQVRISAGPGLLVVTFSTHGYTDQGADYLIAGDSLIRRAVRTGIAVHEVFDDVARARAPRRLVFLDACRERLSKGTRAIVPELESAMSQSFAAAIARATGQVVLAGAPLGGYAYDDTERGNGVFTAAVLDGLRGGARADETGLITVRALADYVEQRVAEWVRDFRSERGEVVHGGLARHIEGPAEGLPLAIAPGFLEAIAKPAAAGQPAAAEAIRAAPRATPRRGPKSTWAWGAAVLAMLGALAVWRGFLASPEKPASRHGLGSGSEASKPAQKPEPAASQPAGAEVPERLHAASPGIWGAEQGPLDMRWHLVPSGDYEIGSPASENGRDDDETRHGVSLTRDVWLGETEVTQRQWQQLTRTRPSRFRGCGEDCPVESVSWYEAITFANLMSDFAGLERCYTIEACKGQLGGGCGPTELSCTGNYVGQSVRFQGFDCRGYRLPTESEWEVAARGGEAGAIFTGALTLGGGSSGPELDPLGWYAENSVVTYPEGAPCAERRRVLLDTQARCGTQRVGQKQPNAYGLYDTSGNVWEWVWDWYGEYPVTRVVDPLGTPTGNRRAVRGGSWDGDPRNCRSATRYWYAPSYRGARVGLRLARTQVASKTP